GLSTLAAPYRIHQTQGDIMNKIIDTHESEVRGYCRSFPATFERAKGPRLTDTEGNHYLDFLAGAGSLNYGHNPDDLKQALVEYIEADGDGHTLDLYSRATAQSLAPFNQAPVAPR